jgi:purine-binding chemotaxis protein CheW
MTHQFCTFHVADFLFGVPVLNVQEVIRHQRMTRVPLSHKTVRGLINLRGQIVTAIDFRQRIELPPLATGNDPVIIVIRTGDGAFCLLVDGVGDVIEVDDSTLEPAPGTISSLVREMVTGVYRLKEHILIALEVEEITCQPATVERVC